MEALEDAKKTAADRRRARILARGQDRLARITGSSSAPAASAPGAQGKPSAAAPSSQPASEAATVVALPTQQPAAPEEEQPLHPSAATGPAGPSLETARQPAMLAAAFAASMKESQSCQSLSGLSEGSSLRQRKAGTSGTGERWSAYEGLAGATAPRRAALPPPPTPADTLSAAVSLTKLLRLAVAVSLAGLTTAAALGCWEPAGSESQHNFAWRAACLGLATAWGQQVQRLPPVVSLAALDAMVLATAFLLLQSRPSLVRSKAGGGPSLLMRAAALVPGLADSLALLGAWQRAAASVADDVALFVLALALLDLAPRVAGRYGS